MGTGLCPIVDADPTSAPRSWARRYRRRGGITSTAPRRLGLHTHHRQPRRRHDQGRQGDHDGNQRLWRGGCPDIARRDPRWQSRRHRRSRRAGVDRGHGRGVRGCPLRAIPCRPWWGKRLEPIGPTVVVSNEVHVSSRQAHKGEASSWVLASTVSTAPASAGAFHVIEHRWPRPWRASRSSSRDSLVLRDLGRHRRRVTRSVTNDFEELLSTACTWTPAAGSRWNKAHSCQRARGPLATQVADDDPRGSIAHSPSSS